jgi:hypothetical protein
MTRIPECLLDGHAGRPEARFRHFVVCDGDTKHFGDGSSFVELDEILVMLEREVGLDVCSAPKEHAEVLGQPRGVLRGTL